MDMNRLCARTLVHRLTWAAMMIVMLPVSGRTLHAQAVTATLLGNVTDAAGLPIPGATVSISEVNTNIGTSAITSENGSYVFSSLKDGVYRVAAELVGFKRAVRDGVIVQVNTTMRVNLTLEVGAVAETVTVVGQSPLLQTDRTDTGRIIESKLLQEVPLRYGNFQAALITVPGTTRPHREHSVFFNSQDSLATEVNGQSRLANNVLLEGIDNNHKTGLLTVLIPSAEAIETVSVSTSNYDAEFGRAGGAVTNVTLKSGTNPLKGVAFFFGNGDGTLAKDYFSGTKAPTSYKQWGLALGGPLIRNRLFFFADYQGTRDNLGQVNRHNIPPLAFRNGDFSGASTIVYDPATGNPDGTGRQHLPGNIIPANRISPIARGLLAFLPPPNVSAALGQNNYEFLGTRKKNTEAG